MSIRFAPERIERFLNELKPMILAADTPIDGFVYKQTGYKSDNVLPAIDGSFAPFIPNMRWGGQKDTHYWFYKKVTTDTPNMHFSLRTGKETEWSATMPQFVVYLNGKIVESIDNNHTTVLLPEAGEYEIYLYAYSGMFDDLLDFLPSLQLVNKDCEALYYDLKVPLDVTAYLEPAQKEYLYILDYLEKAINLVDFRVARSAEFLASVKKALAFLKEEFYLGYCGHEEVLTTCIGHTHIDVAWLWPMAQTREKAVRSFSTVLGLMRQYPEYKFMSSQPQLFKFVKEDAPEVYAEIKERVKEGRFELEGGMWVEADCNLISGESMVRQFLYGKRFFRDEFGAENHILWLPDVFGYSAAMPQILQKSGIDTFVTSKISWNETNQMPFDTFRWQGIDGTEIFSYFLTAQDKYRGEAPLNITTYNATTDPKQLAGSWDRYQDKLIHNETISTYGYGDGGGGPTKEMIETQRRTAFGIPGCPKSHIDTVGNFLARVKEKAEGHPRLCKWVGELYFELHRGTYTSIAKNKRNNRKSEFLFQNAELAASLSSLLVKSDYPQAAFDTAWESILVNQFHDIIPGSSIKEVYDDSDKDYAVLAKTGTALRTGALSALAGQMNTAGGLLVFNPNSFTNSDLIALDDGRKVLVSDIPALGYKVIPMPAAADTQFAAGKVLENDILRVEFDDCMQISRIFDKRMAREVLRDGEKGNVLQAFEDLPRNWDAWDISDYFAEKMWVIDDVQSAEAFSEGDISGFVVKRNFLSSTVTQKIFLAKDSARLSFDTVVDWKEEHILLKALFPVDIFTSKATYDIQFGNVERPTHQNTSWDKARFEVCAHKFADLSEPTYGVALLNDCKYGHDCVGTDLRLSLLRSPTSPNPDADKEIHTFTYALFPHAGDHREGLVSREGYKLNNPMSVLPVSAQTGSLQDSFSMVQCDSDAVTIETVKLAEDGNGIIVRLYEHFGSRVSTSLQFGLPVQKVFLADLMESDLSSVACADNTIQLTIKPFEIVTLRVVF